MDLFDFARLHVKINCKGPMTDWTEAEILNAFCMLPPPSRSVIDSNALFQALFGQPETPKEPEPTDYEKAVQNKKAMSSLGIPVKKE